MLAKKLSFDRQSPVFDEPLLKFLKNMSVLKFTKSFAHYKIAFLKKSIFLRSR